MTRSRFLDVFENPDSQTSPSTANGAVYQNQFDAFQQWERGKVDDRMPGWRRPMKKSTRRCSRPGAVAARVALTLTVRRLRASGGATGVRSG